jgi:hypothetical protein
MSPRRHSPLRHGDFPPVRTGSPSAWNGRESLGSVRVKLVTTTNKVPRGMWLNASWCLPIMLPRGRSPGESNYRNKNHFLVERHAFSGVQIEKNEMGGACST